MDEYCETKRLIVGVQENGIIRNARGRIIARLVEGVGFDSEHINASADIEKLVAWVKANGKHTVHCHKTGIGDEDRCTCGYDEIRELVS